MKTILPALAALLSVLGAGVASAATDPSATPAPAATPAAASPSAAAKADPNQMICKTYEVTGSRLDTKKRCMTRADWDAERRASSDGLSTAQTNASYMAPEGH